MRDFDAQVAKHERATEIASALAELIVDEHDTYHEGEIGDCRARLCVMFFNILARLTL